jgi:predicted esterase
MKHNASENALTMNTFNPSYNNLAQKSSCPCSVAQLLAIFIPIGLLGLFCAIFLPIYLTHHNHHDKVIYIRENEDPLEEYDEYDEYVANYTYATLTPKDGYNNIFIFLGGITEVSNKYFDFFKSNQTIIPKKTKIYFLSGKMRKIKFAEVLGITDPVPCWFNVDINANLLCDNCNDIYDEAKESLHLILDSIDQIANEENMSYDKIYLGGFSQGAIMTNYVLLNSRHELGGYLAFSGYIFDHDLHYNQVIHNLSDAQKKKINEKKDYHALATHSFNDNAVTYPNPSEAYYTYFKEFTDFRLYSFGALVHVFVEQPVLPLVRIWLKERMGK